MMYGLKWTSLLVCMAFVWGAAADGDMMDSEYLHQTNSGFEFTGGLGQAPGGTVLFSSLPGGLTFTSYSFKNSPVKMNVAIIPVILAFEYGITPMFSVGVDLAYGSGNESFANCPSGSTCKSQS